MQKREIQRQISRLIDQLKNMKGSMEEECPIGIISMENWEWPQGVALFALYRYYQESQDADVLSYLVEWFDTKIEAGLPEKNVNTVCPLLTLTYLYEETGKPKYLDVLQEWLEEVMTRFPRTEEGGIQHITTGHLNEGQLWDDTLYMTVLFVARMGNILKNDEYIQESIRQFLVHIKYLTDNSTGLLFHGWAFQGRHSFAKALWGRGNSWYTAGLVDYLEMAELPQGVTGFLLSTLNTQVQALAKLQDECGLWHTLLDDNASYLETSCSAAFAYGMLKAARMGYIDSSYESVGLRALEAALGQIGKDGIVAGVSYGTPVFDTLQEYREIEICPMPYGQSMMLMLLVEALKHCE